MRFSMNLSVQKRIGLLVLSGLAIGLGLFSWLGVQSVNESTRRALEERLTIARIMASHMDQTLEYVLAQLDDAADFDHELSLEEQFPLAADSLRAILARSGVIAKDILLVDTKGQVLRSSPENSNAIGAFVSAFPEVSHTLKTGVPTVSGSASLPFLSEPAVLASTPIQDAQGVVLGALVCAIDVNQSSINAFSEPIVLGDTGYTEIVDGNGLVLARSDPGRPAEPSETSDHPGKFADLINARQATVRTCHRCHGSEEQPERRKDVLAFAPLATASWGVAIRQSEDEALAPAQDLKRRFLILGTIVLTSTFLLVWVGMQGLVRPIKMLTAASKKVAEGDFRAVAPIERRDEIGQLSTAFNTMTHELWKSRNELVMRSEELSALNSIALTVCQSLDLKDVLENAIRKVLDVSRARAGWIMLPGSESSSLEIVASFGSPGPFYCKQAGYLSATCGCHQVFGSGSTLMVNDVSQCPVLAEDLAARNDLTCFASVPIKTKGKTIGIMNVACSDDRCFTERDFALLSSIAYHVGLAIDNATLYREARQKEELRGQLLERVISAQEEERRRIARELHDEYGQAMTGLIMSLESADNMISPEQTRIKDKISYTKSLAMQALDDMRRLTFDLRPSALDDLGLVAAIRSYLQSQLGEKGINVLLHTNGLDGRLPPSVEIVLFRIIQEASRNIIRHGQAENVQVTIEVRGGKVTATVEDDGIGFDSDAVFRSTGRVRPLGLLGIRERAELLGGAFDIKSEPGKGTHLSVEIPLSGSPGEGGNSAT